MNLASAWLPKSCTGVMWEDCDVVHENLNWAADTMKLLEKFRLVQIFETCNRLPEENLSNREGGDICHSFASITPKDPSILKIGHYEKHGHVGYSWAMSRELFDRHGLYEYAIMGSSDHFIAHAAYGDYGPCVTRSFNNSENLLEHFRNWAEPFYKDVQGKVAAVPGEILHLWHGSLANRRYLQRNLELESHGFDPFTDLIAAPGKPFEWAPDIDKQELVDMFADYFITRKEDGSTSSSQVV